MYRWGYRCRYTLAYLVTEHDTRQFEINEEAPWLRGLKVHSISMPIMYEVYLN